MRGYITFVLAVVILSLFLYVFSLPQESSLNEALAMERLYQTEQNAKFLVLEAARQGAQEGLEVYLLTHPTSFNEQDAETAMEQGAYARLQQLSALHFFHVDVRLYCGPEPITYSRCDGCVPLAACPDIIHAEVEEQPDKITGKIWMGSPALPFPRLLLIHAERTDFPMATLGYIPITEERVIELAGTN